MPKKRPKKRSIKNSPAKRKKAAPARKPKKLVRSKKTKVSKKQASKKPASKKPAQSRLSRGNRGNKANIKVVGVGGGGGNAISRMRDDFIRGVEFIAVNTDVQDLEFCNAHKKIAIGKTVTRGLGTGMDPELGRQAAEENREDIAEALRGADLVFVTAGLGGGTGSGASSIVAEVARDMGALTVAVVTKPFAFEGGQRGRIAEEALAKIKDKVDTFIIVPNDRIFAIIGQDTSINKAFQAIDNILRNAVQGIAELIAMPGLINVDFADVKTIMRGSGEALVGIGLSAGKERGVNAVRQVLDFPLLDIAIDGAKGVLFGVSGGKDLKMTEINEIAQAVTESADPAAKVIFGAYHSRKISKGKLRLTLIATGFNATNGLSRNNNRQDELEPPANNQPLFKSVDENKAKESSVAPISSPMDEDKSSHPKGASSGDKSEKTDKLVKKDKDKSTEIWDIPAFLRRKKK